MCERRAAAARPQTEAIQLAETERQVMGVMSASQRAIIEKQREFAFLDELAKVENEIMGIVERAPLGIDAVKLLPDGEGVARKGLSRTILRRALEYKLTTGRFPTQKEIQQWMGP